MQMLPRLCLGLGLFAAAATLTVSEELPAYSTIGHNLGTNQRDFRLYDLFSASAHSNQNYHANFPGYNEVALAIWKGGQEWGARTYGDGSGDPTQSNIGDGNANFNPIWNGFATGNGTGTTNIVGSVSGSSGGVLAFMTGYYSGWNIKFYTEAWNWKDNPNSASGGMDIQGVMCHEYGHALGLGHSSNWNATMYPSTGGGSTKERSVHSDDQAGIQSIYGVRDDARMPRIDDVTGSFVPGGTVVVTGVNFTDVANRVWMNNTILDSMDAGGDPYEIADLDSTNGQTQLSFTLPAYGVEAGSIHVRKGGSGHDRLSEGHPFPFDQGSVTDTILLEGPTSAPAGGQVSYSWTGAPGNSPWWLYWSFSNAGSVINGQSFDVGSPYNTVATGDNPSSGSSSYTAYLPGGASGLNVYLELRTDFDGRSYDSNVLLLSIQ
ncbi:MAG: hypothetical protein DWQ01_21575 [Planctomycetota bacterium]|nr:MAG: hypothetical protein DWQ01_21575 [Planctomycetota bacterium]